MQTAHKLRLSEALYENREEHMNYILRAPKLPVLIDSGLRLYCVTGDPTKDKDLKEEIFEGDSLHSAIDISGESFSYSHEHDTISPLAIKKQNTKKVLIELYNSRKPEGAAEYSVKSPGNTRYSKIFTDIATLVLEEDVQHG